MDRLPRSVLEGKPEENGLKNPVSGHVFNISSNEKVLAELFYWDFNKLFKIIFAFIYINFFYFKLFLINKVVSKQFYVQILKLLLQGR